MNVLPVPLPSSNVEKQEKSKKLGSLSSLIESTKTGIQENIVEQYQQSYNRLKRWRKSRQNVTTQEFDKDSQETLPKMK